MLWEAELSHNQSKMLYLCKVLAQKMKKNNIFFILLMFSVILFSCKKDIEDPVDVGYDYFPVNIGHWVSYKVDSTYYDDFTDSVRVYHYKIKEFVESTFLDNQNRGTQRIERYKQNSDTTNWYLGNVWAMNLTPSTAEKVEENYRFIKLIFPVKKGKIWNGNAYNILGEQEYEFDNVDEPYTVNGTTYDSTVTVIQKIEPNMIHTDYQVEIFAKHIGLIYKKYKSVDISSGDITKGVDYTYTIISYGN
jgi:hypothetical protein